ncbi:MAG: 4Fe-4S ferredoxin [Bryobacterales bacterium]|nr:4Fe-4S ferredoxin [Bryobacterales bacterium]
MNLDADILCVGFGPAMGGFLTTLTRGLSEEGLESAAMPGLPPQVICYERADDISFGVSGVVTRARAIRASFPEFDPDAVPMAAPVTSESLVYLLDPHGASRRPAMLRAADGILKIAAEHGAIELPYIPGFLQKHDGFVLSIGQFNQWAGQQVLMSGLAQIWPSAPVSAPLIEEGRVSGVVLAADGAGVRGALTVVGDGPYGAAGRRLDEEFGLPEGHVRDEWAVGMKLVIELPEDTTLAPGTVIHTFGYPEPEIFGFFYTHPDRIASAGIFVPSWLENPVRTAYRYLQHFIQHPYLWRYVRGGRMKSWGAKSLLESGRRGEPFLAGDGYARIGEGSGSTNVLTGSGVDEAWLTGTQLAEAVLVLLREKKPFTRENLEATYVARRRTSWLERENLVAEKARNGFARGVIQGFLGMALAGFTRGRLHWPSGDVKRRTLKEYYSGRLSPHRIVEIQKQCAAAGISLHDALMDACGWPAIQYDGQLLVTHQDALLMGGKVQAPAGAEDHVLFRDAVLCEECRQRTCIEMCSGQAIHAGETKVPAFEREKCVHCGACLWNCPGNNIAFAAGPGGFHSAEN